MKLFYLYSYFVRSTSDLNKWMWKWNGKKKFRAFALTLSRFLTNKKTPFLGMRRFLGERENIWNLIVMHFFKKVSWLLTPTHLNKQNNNHQFNLTFAYSKAPKIFLSAYLELTVFVIKSVVFSKRHNFYNVDLYLRTNKEFLIRPKFLLPFVEKLEWTFVFMVIKTIKLRTQQ